MKTFICKKYVYSFVCVVIILFIAYKCCSTENHNEIKNLYVQELILEQEQYIEDFESIHKQVVDNYSLYLEKNIDMDSLYSYYSNLILTKVKTREDYATTLLKYFASLKAGHANILFANYCASYWPSYIENRLFIDKPNTFLKKAGFLDKDEIIAINDVPISEWIDDNSELQSGSTESYRRLASANDAFTSYIEQERIYTISRGTDTLDIKLNLPSAENYPDPDTETPYMFYHKYDSVGYIYLKTMQDIAVELFDSAYAQLKEMPHLIVDVRDNGGGSSEVGRSIAEKLIRKEQKHCLNDQTMKPTSGAYKGKLYILTSGYTFSAAESFVIDMRESNNAIIIGEPTAGDTGNGPKTFYSKFGIPFRLPTRSPKKSHSGFPLEGVAISPHCQIIQTVEDFKKGKYCVLEYTLNKIKSNYD